MTTQTQTPSVSCSAFPEKQMPQAYVVRLAGTCCKCAESGAGGSRCGCCDDSGKGDCGGFNGDFVVRQSKDDPCCYEYAFSNEEFASGIVPCKAEKLRLSFTKHDDDRVNACVTLFFEDTGPVTWHKPHVCAPCNIGTLRRIRTNTKCCFPQTITVNGTPVPDFVAPQPEWYAGNPDDLNDAPFWPSLDLDLYEDSPHVPVRYFNGELNLRIKVLHSDGQNIPWGHTLIYSNRLSNSHDFGNGYNWLIHEQPQVVLQKNDPVFIERLIKKDPTRQGKATGCTLVMLRGTRNALWFDEFLPAGSKQTVWIARFGAKHVLQHDRQKMIFRLVAPNGHIWEFDDFTSVCSERVRVLPPGQRANRAPGMFKRHIGPGGEKFQQIVATYKNCQIQNVERVTPQDGKQITERFRYEYFQKASSVTTQQQATDEVAVDDDNAGRLWQVTLERGVKTASGKLPGLRRATFAYYSPNDKHGNVGDLKTIFSEFHSGKTGWERNAWKYREDALHYFRYHKHSIDTYCQGLLKLYLAPEGFYRAKQGPAKDQSIFAIDDNQLQSFSELDVSYHSPAAVGYQSPRRYAEPRLPERAVLEIAVAGKRTPKEGDKIKTVVKPRKHVFGFDTEPPLAIDARGTALSSSAPLWNYARLTAMTTETRADGALWRVSTNFIGQARFRILYGDPVELDPKSVQLGRHSLSTWQEERRDYSEQHGGLTRHYTPSAVTAEFYLGSDAISPNSLEAKGIIYYLEYHSPRKSLCYLKKVSRGPAGANQENSILLHTYDYPKQPKKYAGQDVYAIEKATTWYVATTEDKKLPEQQPVDANKTRDRVIEFAYQFHPSSCQVSQRTTSLPAVPSSQNGSNRGTALWQSFDHYGNVSLSRDLRDVLSYFQYDTSLGVLTKSVRDVDTGLIPWFGKPGQELVTEFVPDRFGRVVKTVGPKFHALANVRPALEIDVVPSGDAPVRTAVVTAFDEISGEIRSAQAYVDSKSDTYILSPATVIELDRAGRTISERAYAVRGFLRQGALDRRETFNGLQAFRLTEFEYANDNTLIATREYYDVAQKKYRETCFFHDEMRRAYCVVDPTGTIQQTTFDARGLPLLIKLGINQEKLSIVSEFEYDNPPAPPNTIQYIRTVGFLGNGLVTTRFDHVDDDVVRVTALEHDWLDRPVKVDRNVLIDRKPPVGDEQLAKFGQGKAEKTEYAGSQFEFAPSRELLNTDEHASVRVDVDVDTFGRVYRSTTRPVNAHFPRLLEEIWRDDAGAVIQHKPAGSGGLIKYQHDRLGRVLKEFHAVRDPNSPSPNPHQSASTIAHDIVLEQREFEHDALGNAIGVKHYRRKPIEVQATGFPTKPAAGDLADARYAGVSRVTYTAFWFDALGRQRAICDFGTNVPARRPSFIPVHSRNVLPSTVDFNVRGELRVHRDPNWIRGYRGEQVFFHDDLGRLTWQDENPKSSCDRRTTGLTYHPDDQPETVTLWNSATGEQTTRYEYDTSLATSDIATGSLHSATVTPDGARIALAFNRQGQVKQMTDPNDTVHRYEFDGLGRPRADQIVQFGRLTDNRVERIQWDYNKQGHVEYISSYGAGPKPLNQVRRRYNELGMVETDSQDHFGSSSHAIAVRLTQTNFNGEPRPGVLSYPGIILTSDEQSDGFSGRQQRHLSYNYLGTGLANDPLGRVGAIECYASEGALSGNMEAEYKYGGLADINELRYSFPRIWTNLGDYDALDARGRVASYFWRDGFSVHEKIKYAYDRMHNPMARLNEDITVTDRDEAYQYDKLSRLKSFQRGSLPRTASGQPATVGIPAGKRTDQQSWQLDSAGNWKGFQWQETEGKNAPKLSHNRQHNTVNEFTSTTGASSNSARWATPNHDDAGNMIRMPDPRSPRDWLRCIYDGWNRLVEVRDRGGNVIANYQYDGLDRRIVKQTKDSEGQDRWRHFFYSPAGQVIEEREASKATELPDFPDRQHFWGADGQLLFSEHGTIDEAKNWSAQDKRLYVLRDALGSTTALMDTSSFLRGRFAYQPYGEPRPLTNDSEPVGGKLWHDFDYLFAGYRYDHETGLYHTRARQYHPLLGLWTGRDPAGYADSMNLYQYVAGSPTSFVDPTGEAISIAAGLVFLAATLLTPALIDPESERGFEASPEMYAAHEQENTSNAITAISLALPMGATKNILFRGLLGSTTTVGLHATNDALTYGFTGNPAYQNERGEFDPGLMAGSYAKSAVLGFVLPVGLSALGRGLRNQRLFVHLTDDAYQQVRATGYLGEGMPTLREVFIKPMKEGRIWATPYTLRQLRANRLRAFLSGMSPKKLANYQHTIELTGEAARAFRVASGPRFSLNVFGWLKGGARQYQFRGQLRYRGGNSISSLQGARRVSLGQSLILRTGELQRLGLYGGIPVGAAAVYLKLTE